MIDYCSHLIYKSILLLFLTVVKGSHFESSETVSIIHFCVANLRCIHGAKVKVLSLITFTMHLKTCLTSIFIYVFGGTHLNYLYFYSFFKNCYWMHLENQFFFLSESIFHIGLAWWLSSKEFTCQCRRCRFSPWVRKIPWRMKWQPTSIFLPGEYHEQRNLADYSQWGCKRVRHDWAIKQQLLACRII